MKTSLERKEYITTGEQVSAMSINARTVDKDGADSKHD